MDHLWVQIQYLQTTVPECDIINRVWLSTSNVPLIFNATALPRAALSDCSSLLRARTKWIINYSTVTSCYPAPTHQVLRAVQLVRGGRTAGNQGLEHAAYHHSLHILGHRLVVPCGEVIPKACLVWKQQAGETTDHTGDGLVSG